MSYKVMFVLSALVALIFGLAFLFVPDIALTQFGTTDAVEATRWASRFFGFASFGLGLVLWFAKDVADEKIQKNFGVAMFVVSIVGFVLSIFGSMAGNAVIRVNAWAPIALFALSGLGYGFMLFLKPKMKE